MKTDLIEGLVKGFTEITESSKMTPNQNKCFSCNKLVYEKDKVYYGPEVALKCHKCERISYYSGKEEGKLLTPRLFRKKSPSELQKEHIQEIEKLFEEYADALTQSGKPCLTQQAYINLMLRKPNK